MSSSPTAKDVTNFVKELDADGDAHDFDYEDVLYSLKVFAGQDVSKKKFGALFNEATHVFAGVATWRKHDKSHGTFSGISVKWATPQDEAWHADQMEEDDEEEDEDEDEEEDQGLEAMQKALAERQKQIDEALRQKEARRAEKEAKQEAKQAKKVRAQKQRSRRRMWL
eukprot:SAG25_NODE_1133_length_3837_cov_10.869984_2_plen_168_part_00